MLPELRDHRGQPNAKVRLAALLVVIGAVVGTAPIVVVPVAGAGWHQLQRLWP
ncbi:MAG TPA: hypothetical protein VHE83_02795 [Mycobacteriales bacterium]|nr:hypothetical protein [Mycobacteriales bacterium]